MNVVTNRMDLLPIVCLMGPTASGKTAMAMDLCDRFPFDIISVDSAMLYRGMDIGSAKPDSETLKKYPHYLIDLCDPCESFSAALFCEAAKAQIAKTFAAGRFPLLVGGTMLYFRALSQGLSPLPQADPTLRARLEAQAQEQGWAAMHAQLALLDPQAAARIRPSDPQRIQRALEVCLLTGATMTDLMRLPPTLPPYRYLNCILFPQDRALLHANIEKRFQVMLEAGFVEEVEALYQRGDLHEDLPSIRCVGYRQIWSYLAGHMTYEQMRAAAVIATRQLAKRQMTWLRSWPDPLYLLPEDQGVFKRCIEEVEIFLKMF